MSPDGGDTSPPTELSAGDGTVVLQCNDFWAPHTQPRPTSGRVSDALVLIVATPLPDNHPPLVFAPSGVPHPPGASAATDLSNTPNVQPLTQQSTVSGAVGAGQPAANRENVDGGPTQETLVSELEQPATPATTGNADAQAMVPSGNAVNGVGDHSPTNSPNAHTPHVPQMEDELRSDNPLLQSFTGVDQKLHSVFGDTIHHNDGRHLNGGIGEDKDCKCQHLHERVVAARLPLYSLPNGQWAKQFLALQTALWHNVRLRGCNSVKSCIFAPLILHRVRSKKTMSEVKTLVWSHMDSWEASRYCALVKELEECAMEDGFPPTHSNCSLELESVGWRFNLMVHFGKLRAAVRAVTDHNPGILYAPKDICTKTGRRVLDVLHKKHPDACIPEERAFDSYANSAELLEAMPIACYKEQISLRAANLRGGAGPYGVDGTMLKEWLLRHEVSSECLREEMVHLVVWLSNDSPQILITR